MNYFFISAAFFAFHLLLAYLVDHISIARRLRRRGRRQCRRSSPATFASWPACGVALLARGGGADRVSSWRFSYAFFFEGLHRTRRHHWRGDHAVRPDADHRACELERRLCSPRQIARRGARHDQPAIVSSHSRRVCRLSASLAPVITRFRSSRAGWRSFAGLSRFGGCRRRWPAARSPTSATFTSAHS